ncbi:hypothetical protein LWC34_15885 [Kibdelosporangium philippinense]|uniref:Trypsin-like peptidase domain-containing protein n=1 Tax=Kibdelosporangium philippinense TaxID=211113 RepID=A0ABS8Z8V0_9PSEU|nr:hypothetical protein [Kibdelosporangium philippinense]MCE7004305.1 hypothetical protein [Kibdelosporangium philippinense]
MIRVLLAAALMTFPAPPVDPVDIAEPAFVAVSVTWHGWVRDKQTGEVFGGAKGYEVKANCPGAVINPAGYVVTTSHCVHSRAGSEALFDRAIADLRKVGRVGDALKARTMLAEKAIAEGPAQDRSLGRVITVDRDTATVVDLKAPDDGDIAVLWIPRTGLPSIEVAAGPVDVMQDGRALDKQGRLLGLARHSGGIAQAKAVHDLMRDIKPALGVHDRNYRTGLERFYAGSYDSAVDYFTAVVKDSPTNTQAADFRDMALAKGGSPSDGRELTTLLAYILGGITLVTAGLGVWLVLRRAAGARIAQPQPDPSL